MKYDFDTIINRKNTNSLKYDFAVERGMPQEALPLWVADMDFAVAPEILADIQKTVAHGIFGYTDPKEGYYEAIIQWFSTRFGFTFSAKDVVKTPGVVYALAQAICAFTEVGDRILIQTPVYYPFYSLIQENGRNLVKNPLVYKDGRYVIDFEDFEKKVVDNHVKMFIFCSPHNPVGRVWTRDEIEKLNDICEKHSVIIVSDEIHCDFTYEGHKHTSFGTINKNVVVATAPSKTFNVAGLQVANIIIQNENMRRKYKEVMSQSGYSQLNTVGIAACQSAYTNGAAWLTELKAYLVENTKMTKAFLAEHLPNIRLIQPEGTYLLWLDFQAYGLSQEALDQHIVHGAQLWLDSGTMFGSEGEGFQRVNIACPRATLREALERLKKEFGNLKVEK